VRQVLVLFLVEATLLATTGALLGLLLAAVTIAGLGLAYPSFPVAAPLWSPPAAVAVALGTGLAFGALPARRAARLDPVQALTGR
jgi:putative ABC transport system permease protein